MYSYESKDQLKRKLRSIDHDLASKNRIIDRINQQSQFSKEETKILWSLMFENEHKIIDNSFKDLFFQAKLIYSDKLNSIICERRRKREEFEKQQQIIEENEKKKNDALNIKIKMGQEELEQLRTELITIFERRNGLIEKIRYGIYIITDFHGIELQDANVLLKYKIISDNFGFIFTKLRIKTKNRINLGSETKTCDRIIEIRNQIVEYKGNIHTSTNNFWTMMNYKMNYEESKITKLFDDDSEYNC